MVASRLGDAGSFPCDRIHPFAAPTARAFHATSTREVMVLALLPVFCAAPPSAMDSLVPTHQILVSFLPFLVVDVGSNFDVQRVAVRAGKIALRDEAGT